MPDKLVVVVPGFGSRTKGSCLDTVIKGLERFAVLHGANLQPDDGGDTASHKYTYYEFPNETTSLRFKEAYWGDLVIPLTDKSPLSKMINGFLIVSFWIFSLRVVKVALSNRFLLFWSVFSAITMLMWYYGVTASFLTFLGTDEGKSLLPAAIHSDMVEPLVAIGKWMGGLKAWAIASALLIVLPINAIVDVAYSTRRYFQNDDDMAAVIQTRIASVVNDARKDDVSSVVVVAHSFGAVAALQALSEFTSDRPVHLITVGSPLAIACARSSALEKSTQDLLGNESIKSWNDIYSNDDWMCSAPPVKDGQPRFAAHSLKLPSGFSGQTATKAHFAYFNEDLLYELILSR